MKRNLFKASVTLVGAIALTGCFDKNSPEVRVLHASPDAPSVDVAVNGGIVLSDVAYREGSGFLKIGEGANDIAVFPVGGETPVIAATLNFDENTEYSILAVNTVANIEPLVIANPEGIPASGYAQLQVVHAAPGVPEVDVYVSAPDQDFEELVPLLSEVPFKAYSDVLEVPAGDYRVRITLSGDSTVVYDSGTIKLNSRDEIIAAATEVNTGLSPVGLTLLTDAKKQPVVKVDDARARIRVVHASPDAPEVDVLVNDGVVLADVPFKVGSDYLTVLSDTYNVKVNAAGTAMSVIDADLKIAAATDYTVAAVNFLNQIEPLVLVDNNALPASGNAKLRLVHAAPSAQRVDVYITAPAADISMMEPSFEDFAFKNNSGYLEVPAGSYQVRVTLPDTKTVAIDTGAVALMDGQVRTAFALDPAGASDSFGVLLLEDRN